MNTANDLYRRRQGASPSACPPDPCVCSVCGMLECLCRPRFFAGQILTADDLNRLDGYIRGKHRLHNRQLHGWGVVNGLEVTCNPCGDGVAVGCGYALSPCGDDIVVCEAVSVDVCALIKRCCADEGYDPCVPPRRPRPRDCDEGEQEWILAIRYAETPTRGVTPLRTPGCTGGCGGGCAGGTGCTCGTGSKPANKPRGAPVQCEPTVVCEGYAFEVYRKPAEIDDPRGDNSPNTLNPQSELLARFRCCISLLVTQLPKLTVPIAQPTTEAAAQALHAWNLAMRALLRRYLASHGSTNCELLAKFNTIPFPASGTLANGAAIYGAALLLIVVWIDALLACLCSALLPPCPAPSNEVRVPLASIHVNGNPCRVLRICNLSVHRKFATTFPALQYWLGLFPFVAALRKLLERMCCADPVEPQPPGGNDPPPPPPPPAPPVPGAAPAGPLGAARAIGANGPPEEARGAWEHATGRLNPTVDEPQRIGAARTLLASALGRTGKTLDPAMLATGLMRPGGRQFDGGGKDGLSDAELDNLPQFLAANLLLRPIAGAALPSSLSGLSSLLALGGFGGFGGFGEPGELGGAGGLAGTVEPGAAAASPDELASLRAELTALQASVQAQAAQIEQLRQAAPAAPEKPATPSRSKRRHKDE